MRTIAAMKNGAAAIQGLGADAAALVAASMSLNLDMRPEGAVEIGVADLHLVGICTSFDALAMDLQGEFASFSLGVSVRRQLRGSLSTPNSPLGE
jgi:hypothetical protein